jgi:Tfp pilus assembly protein PilF
MQSAIARVLTVVSLVVFGFAAGCQSEAQKHLYKADEMFENRDFEGAKRELQKSIELDPNLLEAQKSLANLSEFLGDPDTAARAFQAASMLDPTDQKLMQKARYYKALELLSHQADQALADIEAGKTEEGVKSLKEVLRATKTKATREKALAALKRAGGVLTNRGDQLMAEKKFADAFVSYEQAAQAFVLIAQATQSALEPAAESAVRGMTQAAKQAGEPDAPFRVLNELLVIDPENKVANTELAQIYLSRKPPDYYTAADLLERAGAPDEEVSRLRKLGKRQAPG